MKQHPRVKVIGVGGGAGRAVRKMAAVGVDGVEFVVVDTDVQSPGEPSVGAPAMVQIGAAQAKGRGTDLDPNLGRQAAIESVDNLIDAVDNVDVLFIVTALGGGTGSGAAPVIAGLASELGCLVLAVAMTPFDFEGRPRQQRAERTLRDLQDASDLLITVPAQRLLASLASTTPPLDAFACADEMLAAAVREMSALIVVSPPPARPLSLGDFKEAVAGLGSAVIGMADAEDGDGRATAAAEAAIGNAFVAPASIATVRSAIVGVTGGPDLSILDVDQAAAVVRHACPAGTNVIVATIVDPAMAGRVRVTLVAGPMHAAEKRHPAAGFSTPVDLAHYSEWRRSSPVMDAPRPPMSDPSDIVLVWDPAMVAPDDYATLIVALGDLARAAGAVGISRRTHTIDGPRVRRVAV